MANPSSPSPNLDAANLLSQEWQFRQRHCWAILSRFVVTAVSIAIVPHVIDDLPKKLGAFVMVLPALGSFVALAAVWLFGAEYVRMHSVLVKYRESMGPYSPAKPDLGVLNWFFVYPRIGWVTFIVLLALLSTLAIVNTYLVWRLVP